jgi:hypothetical protein
VGSMPPKMKISINLGSAAAAAVTPALTSSIPNDAATEAASSMKRDREDEQHDDEGPVMTKRFKQESVPLVTVIKQESIPSVTIKDEPVAEDDIHQPLFDAAIFSAVDQKCKRSWLSEADELLHFMEMQDKLNFFLDPSSAGQPSVSLVRAQLGDGIFDTFADFVNSLRHVYLNAEKYVGTDVHKQSLKLLEILDKKLQKLPAAVVGVKDEFVSEHLSSTGSEDEAGPAQESDDDAPIDVKFVSKEDLMDDVKYTKETAFSDDDDDDEQPRARLRLTFQDKYENHPDHADRPFWVCLMVRLLDNHCDGIFSCAHQCTLPCVARFVNILRNYSNSGS